MEGGIGLGWPMYVKDKFIQPKLPNHRPKITKQLKRYKKFRTLVIRRDNYTCQVCGNKKSKRSLTVHHIDGYRYNPEWRLYLGNAITLCHECHNFYNSWSGNVNTSEKWFEFLEYRCNSK